MIRSRSSSLRYFAYPWSSSSASSLNKRFLWPLIGYTSYRNHVENSLPIRLATLRAMSWQLFRRSVFFSFVIRQSKSQ